MKSNAGFRMGQATLLAASFLLLIFLVSATAAPPVVSNVRASQRPGTGLVDIYYDVADPDGDHVAVSAAVSLDGGATYSGAPRSFSGSGYGADITPGSNRQITWDAGADLDPLVWSRVKVKVTADDGYGNAPAEMAYIPPGSFWMGDSMNDGDTGGTPQHQVYVSAFYMDKYEVTGALWNEVKTWAVANGYTFDNAGSAKATSHPIQAISWFDMVKWCNARSEMRGRDPVYYTSGAQTTIYRTGQINLTNGCVRWTANGYRLPTEAEWEKAARGGTAGKRFPWGDTITHSQANYYSTTGYAYDISPTRNYHPTWGTGNQPYSSPGGSFAANGYGLYDMAGNMWEWCWDWYDGSWYSNAGAIQNDTRGPSGALSNRVLRGGTWYDVGASDARCAVRGNFTPSIADYTFGFRCLRGL